LGSTPRERGFVFEHQEQASSWIRPDGWKPRVETWRYKRGLNWDGLVVFTLCFGKKKMAEWKGSHWPWVNVTGLVLGLNFHEKEEGEGGSFLAMYEVREEEQGSEC
jgi:hypothetical protein